MTKPTITIVFTGHVDHGKSTLIGRILLNTGSLSREKMVELKKISRDLGKDTELAFLSDQLKEERDQERTIDTTRVFFRTRKRNYCIIDSPGHAEFIKNMISGAASADAAALLVDVKEGAMEQTRRHAYLLSMIGINRVVVCLNKMDAVDFSQETFERLKEEVMRILARVGITAEAVIPVSARHDINISSRSGKTKWYRGPAFLEALDAVRPRRAGASARFRFAVQDVYTVGAEKIIAGKVLSGIIKVNDGITVLPSMAVGRVTGIRVFGAGPRAARAGESVGLVLEEHCGVKRGDILSGKGALPAPVSSFTGSVFWLAESPLKKGEPYTFRCSTQDVECRAEKILRVIDSSMLKEAAESSDTLIANNSAAVAFRTTRPVVIEKFTEVDELGRFAVESGGTLRGIGIIKST